MDVCVFARARMCVCVCVSWEIITSITHDRSSRKTKRNILCICQRLYSAYRAHHVIFNL